MPARHGRAALRRSRGQGEAWPPCRIYAPVGTHETLLAYLVRRLLENGANSSFVNRIADPAISVDALIADPTETVLAMVQPGAKHERIALPADLFEGRKNSAGLDLSNEAVLQALGQTLRQTALSSWDAVPALIAGTSAGPVRSVVNPGDHRDVVGSIRKQPRKRRARPWRMPRFMLRPGRRRCLWSGRGCWTRLPT